MSYRSRPTAPNPFGEVEPPTTGDDLDTILERARADRDAGMQPVVEYHIKGAGWAIYRHIVTCADLQRIHLAREKSESYFDPSAAKMRTAKRWEIDPAGQQAISDAATADPLDFNLADYAVNR